MNPKLAFFIKKITSSILVSVFLMTQVASETHSEETNEQDTQEVMKCFSSMDQTALNALAMKTEKMQKEINSLCQEDKRDEAEELSIVYKKELDSSEEFKAIKNCGDISQKIFQQMPMISYFDKNEDDEEEDIRICD